MPGCPKLPCEQVLGDKLGEDYLELLQRGVLLCKPFSYTTSLYRVYYKHGRELWKPLSDVEQQARCCRREMQANEKSFREPGRILDFVAPEVTKAYSEKRALWKL